jgi:Fe-S cluster biogenesis protein NfuA
VEHISEFANGDDRVARAERGLDAIRAALVADGFGLSVDKVSYDGTVVVALDALDGACLDCLASDHVLEQIVRSALVDADVPCLRVVLTKRGFAERT